MKTSGFMVGLLGLAFTGRAEAQVVFHDFCVGYSLVAHADGSERTLLPFLGATPLDASRGSSPFTVLLAEDDGLPGLHAVAVYGDEMGGFLVDAAVPLLQPGEPAAGGHASFSPTGDRIAYVSDGSGQFTLHVGDVVRDTTGKVIDLTNITFVANLSTLGSPSDSGRAGAATGMIDFSPDGTKIVAVSYEDLWILRLGDDGHSLASSAPLTRTRSFAERSPRWSPDGSKIAISGGSYQSGQLYVSALYIHVVDASSGARTQIVTKQNKGGSQAARDYPNWSQSGSTLLFTAAASSPRQGSCGSYVNGDLFTIDAAGASRAVNVTNTAGTSVEGIPKQGW